jgi:hypothetical protein
MYVSKYVASLVSGLLTMTAVLKLASEMTGCRSRIEYVMSEVIPETGDLYLCLHHEIRVNTDPRTPLAVNDFDEPATEAFDKPFPVQSGRSEGTNHVRDYVE